MLLSHFWLVRDFLPSPASCRAPLSDRFRSVDLKANKAASIYRSDDVGVNV